MATRLRDVADRVNLSPGLVSKVLNRRPDVWASEETRRRIFEAAREMGYRPNAAARSLRSGKTGTVGFLFSEGFLHREIIETVAERLSGCGYRLLVQALPTPDAVLAEMAEVARTRVCDGIILWSTDRETERQGTLLEEMEMPFVAKGRLEATHPEWLQADFDHEAMMTQAVNHAVSLGRRRIAYMGYTAEDAFAGFLLSGFEQAVLAATGRPADPDLILHAPGSSPLFEQAMDRWLDLPREKRPDAVVVGAGRMAWIGIEMALARRALRIGERPQDLVVAGNGDHDYLLLFGQGRVYRRIASLDLAGALVERLLIPLLLDTPVEERIVRLCPPLEPSEGLNLLERGVRLTPASGYPAGPSTDSGEPL